MKMLKIYIKRIDLKNYEVIGQEKKNSFMIILLLQWVGQLKFGFGVGEFVNVLFLL